jgi:DNA-binding IclR family transcriptional regulator
MHGNQSVDRALDVIELLDQSPDDTFGVREIARRLDLAVSIVQRLLNTLAARGFVEQASGTRRYRLGVRARSLGQGVDWHRRMLNAAESELKALAGEHRLNGFLGVLRRDRAAYLLAVQSSGPITVRVAPGSEAHLHSTAMGKILAAQLSDAAVRQLLAPSGKQLAAVTPRTLTRMTDLLKDLRLVRERGTAVADEENIIGIYSIGAPIRDASGAVVAALSVAFPKRFGPGASVAAVRELLIAAAARVSAAMGFTPESAAPLAAKTRKATG